MRKKWLLVFALILVLQSGIFCVSAAQVPDEISIFALSEPYQDDISIPDDCPQSYSLAGHTWSIVEGESVKISGDGTVTVAGNTTYYHRTDSGLLVGSLTPTGIEGEYSVFEYEFGDTVVLIDGMQEVTFHSINYATYFAEKTMNEYLAENVKDGMTEYEIADLCCQFVAGYDYGTESTSYTGMIVTGSGDCWASTSTLLYMLEAEGILCESRDASTDPGAGSGHINVVASLDGEYYILDAGYVGTAPRDYSISKMNASSIYTYSAHSDSEIYITGLVLGSGITEIEIPEQLDGYTVTGIADGAFSGNGELVRVILPDTIEYLGDKAFYQNYALESINLPEGLKTIGMNCFVYNEALTEVLIPSTVTEMNSNVFLYCCSLERIVVDEDNEVYCSLDGVLFDKDMKTLRIFPEGKGDPDDTPSEKLEKVYQVPDGVETIGDWAFASVSLKEVVFPDTLTSIEYSGFYFSSLQNVVLPEGMTSIKTHVFRNTSIENLTLPSGLKRIEDEAFYGAFISCGVTLPEGVEYVGTYAFAGVLGMYIRIPASVQEIGTKAFDFYHGWFNFGDPNVRETSSTGAVFFDRDCAPVIGENAFNEEVVCVYEDSYMHDYALENNLYWWPLEEDGTVQLQQEWLDYINNCEYTGEPVEPYIHWDYQGAVCPFEIKDAYLDISYSDNINPGDCDITITGMEFFSGTVRDSFRIYGSVAPDTPDEEETPPDVTEPDTPGEEETPPDVTDPTPDTPEPSGPEQVMNPFSDVRKSDYFYKPVLWAVENHITSGISATRFAPHDSCTRAQVVTFLWRAAGEPAPTSTRNPFKDVKSSAYYYDAVLWAVEKGITTGMSATSFGPNSPCTRGQVVTFLWRAAGQPEAASAKNPFTDVKTNEFYYEAVLWAVEEGITTGTSATKFSPGQTCTRAQVVTFLYRAQ